MDSVARRRKPSAFLTQQVEAQRNKEAAIEIVVSGWPTERDGQRTNPKLDDRASRHLQRTSHDEPPYQGRHAELREHCFIQIQMGQRQVPSWRRKTFSPRAPDYWDQAGRTWDKNMYSDNACK